MAFRIPSSGLHSGIALIIKGTYPSPDPASTNVIIAPSRIVHVHGSDYDIDSLSVIIRTRTVDVFGENATANLGALIDKALAEDTTYGENGFINNLQPNQVMGYTNYNPNNLSTSFNEIMLDYEGTMLPLEDLLEIAIERVRERASALIADRTMDKDLKKRMLYELIGDTGKYDKSLEYKLIKAYQAIHKNKIVDNFVELLTTATSRK
jgi:hypothetical protein